MGHHQAMLLSWEQRAFETSYSWRDSTERFDVTTVESSVSRELLPAEDNPPIGAPLVVPRLLGLTFDVRQHCNEFSGNRKENPDRCCHYQTLRHDGP